MNEAEILDGILRREGSRYTNRAADRGGPTKFGITLATLREERGAHTSAADVANLTEAEARAIYRERYIIRPRFDRIEDDRLRALLIDFGVNSGPKRAVLALQDSIGATPDGRIGPETLARIAERERAELDEVYADVLRARLKLYVDIVLGDSAVKRFREAHGDTQLDNLRGWMNRLAEFL